MKNLCILGLAGLLALPAAAAEPVAIVYSLSGKASLTAPVQRTLRLFDRLPAGTAVEVSPGSRMALAFVNGNRYELSERSRVTIGQKDLASRTGPVRSLPPVPPLPRLSPITAEDRPGPKAGAVRIRSEEIGNLSPDGTFALADATVLRFQPAGGAARHRLEIEDALGIVAFRTDTQASEVLVPARLLAPGAAYHWTVTALDRPGPAMRGTADFVTLSRKAASARERWRKTIERLSDGSAAALLDAVDHGLGLETWEKDGAVVESVAPGSPGDAAGLRPEDRILSWFTASSSGGIRFPYDLLPLELEEAPRRAVTLRGTRGRQEMAWTLTGGWGITTRPELSTDLAVLYLEGRENIAAGDFAEAERSWWSAAESARAGGQGRLAAWFLDRLALELDKAGKWPESDAAQGEALTALNREAETFAAILLLARGGTAFERRGAWDAAVERYEQALALARALAPKSLLEARMHNSLGVTAAKRGDYLAAQELLLQALAIREELAPGTVEVAGSLNNLGILARRRGDLAAAEGHLTRGEDIQRRLAPDGADHALFFQNLGNLAGDRGDLESGQVFHRKALAIFEKTAPGGDGVSDCLSNLAAIAMELGDLAAADDLLWRSLALQERNAPEGLEVAYTLIHLGNVASRRDDLDAAELYYRRALSIQENLSPNGPEASFTLGNLGIVASLRSDFITARAYLQRALAIEERLAPDSLDVAVSLTALGRFERDSGSDLAKAEKLLRQALGIFEIKAPESLQTSGVLRDLGEVAARRGRLAEALALLRRALDLQNKLSPGTTDEAEALHLLGRTERRAGRHEDGTRNLCLAIDVLDRQRTRLGGTPEARTSFEASLVEYYYACLEGLIELGQPAEAFHALERGRARSLLALLSERDLGLSGLPPELAAERRKVNADYDRVQSQLAHLSSGRNDAEIEQLTRELRNLQARQEEIITRMRREAPRPATLQAPEPLDLTRARAALDPGTVLLEYAVGPERTWLFVVHPASAAGAGLSVFPIAAGATTLREEVETFRRLLKRSGSDRAALQVRARRLYDLLVRPAQRSIARAQRILFSPNGPLHTLPFSSLLSGDRYLVEWKPIHSALSATVYAELVQSRPALRNPGEEQVAAFGAPVYPPAAESPADPEVRDAIRRGLALKPLPSSRKEVEAIAALYPRTQVYLGREATEERARSLGPQTRLVHFACHGLLDERFPLNSSLALSLPEQQAEGQSNGLLQAWEIFESLRLDADLVTLSACDTALGREMGGEGMVGLTRAFQYAGARSVLASLWSVEDDSTSRLMQRFYGHLRDGKPKDEALRAAQIDLIRGGSGSSHPFHWAAFQLVGDWR